MCRHVEHAVFANAFDVIHQKLQGTNFGVFFFQNLSLLENLGGLHNGSPNDLGLLTDKDFPVTKNDGVV